MPSLAPVCSDANVNTSSPSVTTSAQGTMYHGTVAIPANARSVVYDFNFTHTGDSVTVAVLLQNHPIGGGRYVNGLSATGIASGGTFTLHVPFDPVTYARELALPGTLGLVETAAGNAWTVDVIVSGIYGQPTPVFSLTMTQIVTTSLPGYGVVPPFGLLAVAPGATFPRRFQYSVGQVPHGNQPFTTLIAYENAIDATLTQSKYPYGPPLTQGDYYPMVHTSISQACLVMTVTVDTVGSDYPSKYPGTPIDHTGYRYWIFCPELSGNLSNLDAIQVWMVSEAFRVDKTGLGGGIPPPPPPPGIGTGPSNHQDDGGNYHAVQNSLSSVYYNRSNFEKPGSPGVTFDTASSVPASDPKTLQAWGGQVFRDRSERVWMVYCESKPDMSSPQVRFVTSDDDGKTWSTPTVAIPGGKHPAIAIQKDETFNTIIKAAFVAGTKPNTGTLQATSRANGETTDSAVFTFNDSTGKPLTVVDDSFGIAHAPTAAGLWLLHCIISGDGTTSHWYSADECKTWTKVG